MFTDSYLHLQMGGQVLYEYFIAFVLFRSNSLYMDYEVFSFTKMRGVLLIPHNLSMFENSFKKLSTDMYYYC